MTLSDLVYLISGERSRPNRKKRKSIRSPHLNPNHQAAYRAWIRTLDCLVPLCVFRPVHAAHTGSDGGIALKASDWSCVPLCHFHHLEFYHAKGKHEFEDHFGISFASEVERLNASFRQAGDQ